jgi:hypothetical protein
MAGESQGCLILLFVSDGSNTCDLGGGPETQNLDFYRGLVVARLPVHIPPRVAETRQFHGEQKCIVLVITVCWLVDYVLIVCDDTICGVEGRNGVLQNGQQ